MSGEHELKTDNIAAQPTGTYLYAKFPLSKVPDNTRVYVQAVITSAAGTGKSAVREFLVRNKPI